MAIAFSAGCVRRSLIMALVVGPILTVINQGDSLVSEVPFNVWKAALTFVVPYVVATVSAVATQQSAPRRPAPCQAAEPPLGSPRSGQGRPADSEAAPLKARVYVTLKPGVLDPQGKAIANALDGLGFAGVGEVRQGKVIDLVLDERDPDKAHTDIEAMCQRLLANTVIEDYEIELEA
jgi:phosphoribosylformylglycinamidine synthase